MGTRFSPMDNFSILVLDDNPVSLGFISKLLAKFDFRVLPFQTAEGALDSLRGGVAKEVELDLVLAEVHLTNTAMGTLANSDLFHHILNELQVPLITMCAYDDEEAISECMALEASFHVVKPLDFGTLKILGQKAHEHRSRRVIPGSSILKKTNRRMDSSSARKPKRMFIPGNSNTGEYENEEDKKSDAREACGFSKSGRFKWSTELHEKFMEAVEVLGLKYATPERILQHMNVKDVTLKQIANHLQKHRIPKQTAEQEETMKPLSELILSAYNANATTRKAPITPVVSSTIRKKCPVSRWTQMEKSSVDATASKTDTCTPAIYRDDTKSVWDKYQNSLQKRSSLSRKKLAASAKSNAVSKGEGTTVEAPNAAGKMGQGNVTPASTTLGEGNGTPASTPLGSSTTSGLLMSPLDEPAKNSQKEAAGNGGDLVDDTNNSATAEMEPSDPSHGWEEVKAFWMSQLEGSSEQQVLVPDEQLQVDNAWNHALQSVSLTNTGAPLIAQEAADAAAPAVDPVLQFAEDYELWAWSPHSVAGDDYGNLL